MSEMQRKNCFHFYSFKYFLHYYLHFCLLFWLCSSPDVIDLFYFLFVQLSVLLFCIYPVVVFIFGAKYRYILFLFIDC